MEDEFKDAEDNENPVEYTDAEGYQRIDQKWFDFKNAFTYDSEQLREVIGQANPGNTAVTEEMKEYEPGEKMMDFGGVPIRLVFYGGQEYTDHEKAKLKEYKEYVKSLGQPLIDRDEEVLKFLHAKKFVVAGAHGCVVARHKFRNERMPIHLNSMNFDLLNNGCMYVQGRDRFYRPILTINLKYFSENNPEPHMVCNTSLAYQEYIKHHMLYLGHVENMLLIINQAGSNIRNFPYTLVKTLMQTISVNDKGRARSVFMLNSPRTFSFVWNTIKYFLEENQIRKVNISSTNNTPGLLELVAPHQLEEQFGGTQKNRGPGEYWPPSFPDQNFGVGEKTDMANVKFDQADVQEFEIPKDEEMRGIDQMPEADVLPQD